MNQSVRTGGETEADIILYGDENTHAQLKTRQEEKSVCTRNTTKHTRKQKTHAKQLESSVVVSDGAALFGEREEMAEHHRALATGRCHAVTCARHETETLWDGCSGRGRREKEFNI
jgi:hypothetical protein